MKKLVAIVLSMMMLLAVASVASADTVLQVGFENSLSEPVGQGMVKWQELLAAIRRLPADFRDAILLHYYQGYGITEIAQMLDVPEGTISSRLSRGRKKLEEILKESDAR